MNAERNEPGRAFQRDAADSTSGDWRGGLYLAEALRFTYDSLRQNWVRAVLTSLGMVVGTASLILVVTVGISGRAYIMNQIKGVGSNLIYAYYETSDSAAASRGLADNLTWRDIVAIREQVRGVQHLAPIVLDHSAVVIDGLPRTVTLIGTVPEYMPVRNIVVMQGRFLDAGDQALRNKVCLVTQSLYDRLQRDLAFRGYVLLYGLRFEVVGVFRERVDTFGQSEVSSYTAIIPMSVMRYFKETEAVDMIYASAADLTLVPQVTDGIKSVLQGRHRRESLYRVQNLTEILSAASKISLGLTIVLLLIAAISLVSSGIGIMNIMLITVTERTREIGIKKAVGATRGVVLLQFLSESVVLSLGGGLIGILVGTSLPFSVAFFAPSVKIEFSWVSVAVGLAATVAVGVVFGLLPAGRAARLDPVECLRHE